MAEWITPITDRVLDDVTHLKSVIRRIENAGWDTRTDQNDSDKYYWKYGDGTLFYLSAFGDMLYTVANEPLVVHGDQQSIKGAWNFFDANRIITNSIFLRDLMNSMGFTVEFEDQQLLTETDFPFQDSVNGLYKTNIQKLLDAFYPFDHPTFSYGNTAPIYTNANSMEICLQMLYDFLNSILTGYYYSGESYCGESIVL